MVEILRASKEFEQNMPHEIEQKFLPIFPEELAAYRTDARPIEQLYLSHPSEKFNLRLREELIEGELRYTATLKDRGRVTSQGLDRLEVETEIRPETYAYYKTDQVPVLRKLRAMPHEDIMIDFFEDGHVQVESENSSSWQMFSELNNNGDHFVDVSGEKSFDNEWRAHFGYRRDHSGDEALVPAPELNIEQAAQDIIDHSYRNTLTIVQVSGRSGSGKSTYVRQLKDRLDAAGISCDVVSTDDYHRGASWLREYNNGEDWQHWDEPIVYDTAALAEDIDTLKNGRPVPRRYMDFTTQEPAVDGIREPASVLIVEGIMTRSPDLSELYSLNYSIETPPATSMGRRLLRDLIERPQFADPAASLRYMLEEAEPAWRKQTEQPA